MSNEAITWAYRQSVTTGAKFVLVALADLADEAHSCYPGQAKLAAMTGQGERTVRRQLLELEMAGYVTRARRFDKAGHRTSDRYVMPVGQEIPTGQNGQRPNEPVAKKATGQSGHRPNEPLATDDVPTGQNGRVSLREPTDNDSLRSSLPPKTVKPKTDSRGTRLPEDWKPSTELVSWARREGYSDAWARKSTDRFRDHWLSQPGTRGRKLDWGATWRNWLRTDAERNPGNGRPGTGHAPTPQPPQMRQVHAELEARIAAENAAAVAEVGDLQIGRAV